MIRSPGELAARMVKMERAITGKDMRKHLTTLTPRLRADAHGAAASDLGGDRRFSGWKGPDPLDVSFHFHRNGQGVTVGRTRGSAGPWRVAQTGRNQGNAGGFAGPGVNIRTGLTARTKSGGLRKVRSRRARRWNGTTDPKFTWDDAETAMERDAKRMLPKAVTRAVVDAFKG